MSTDYQALHFATPKERTDRVVAKVAQFADSSLPLRMLDIGCGAGDIVFALAEKFPNAEIVGVDISLPNIDEANRRLQSSKHRDRISFVADDFMAFEAKPFDVMVSWSTLHLIPYRDAELYGHINRLLKEDGFCVFAMPYKCGYNGLLTKTRSLFRSVRHPVLDRLVAKAAKVMHPDQSLDFLIERMHYMYVIPDRFECPAMHQWLENEFGLQLVEWNEEPHDSLAQMKQRMSIFWKDKDRDQALSIHKAA